MLLSDKRREDKRGGEENVTKRRIEEVLKTEPERRLGVWKGDPSREGRARMKEAAKNRECPWRHQAGRNHLCRPGQTDPQRQEARSVEWEVFWLLTISIVCVYVWMCADRFLFPVCSLMHSDLKRAVKGRQVETTVEMAAASPRNPTETPKCPGYRRCQLVPVSALRLVHTNPMARTSHEGETPCGVGSARSHRGQKAGIRYNAVGRCPGSV